MTAPQRDESLAFVIHGNPVADGYIAELDSGSFIRLSPRMGEYLLGDRGATDEMLSVAERIGVKPEGRVEELSPDLGPRLRVISLAKIQYDLVRSADNPEWFRRLSRLFDPRVVFPVALGLFIAGLCSFAFRDNPWESLQTPVSYVFFVLLIPGIFLTTFIHEFAHALTLRRYGRGPRRAGIMLFLLAPAGFCDVSPVWLLPRRERVAVCAAGVICHLGLGGAALLVALIMDGAARQVIDLYGLLVVLTGLINLIPFVKFDGYLVLISILDKPFLHQSSTTLATQGLARAIVTGESLPDAQSSKFLFGVASLITPPLIIAVAVVRFFGIFAALGIVGGILLALLLLLVAVMVWNALARTYAIMVHYRATVIQKTIFVVCVVMAVVGLLMVPVPRTGSGMFRSDVENNETATVAFRPSIKEHGLPETVNLENRGILRQTVATGSVDPSSVRDCSVARLDYTFFYISGFDATEDAVCAELSTLSAPVGVDDGLLSYHRDDVPLWRFLVDSVLGRN